MQHWKEFKGSTLVLDARVYACIRMYTYFFKSVYLKNKLVFEKRRGIKMKSLVVSARSRRSSKRLQNKMVREAAVFGPVDRTTISKPLGSKALGSKALSSEPLGSKAFGLKALGSKALSSEPLGSTGSKKNFYRTVRNISAETESIGEVLYQDTDVIYLGYIGGQKFKYGQSSDFKKRLLAHKKPGVFSCFLPLKIFPCVNGVASEKKVRDYVRRQNLRTNYKSRGKSLREIILIRDLDRLADLTAAMHKFSEETPRSAYIPK